MKLLEWIFGILGMVTFAMLGLMFLILTPHPWLSTFFHHDTKLHSTISSDGKVIAVLKNAGTDRQKLLVRELEKGGKWLEIQAPAFTKTIRFGLMPNELLLTSMIKVGNQTNRLSKFDLKHPENGFLTLYEANGLSFPLEVSPGQYLLRTCSLNEIYTSQKEINLCQAKGLGSYWVLLTPGKSPIRVTPKQLEPVYSQPNVTDKGFFWISDFVVGVGPYGEDAIPKTHPMLLSFPFPGGEAPIFEVEHLSPDSNINCDYQSKRCLRTYISNPKSGAQFIYKIEIIWKEKRCAVPNVQGFIGDVALTPDGSMAVVSIATSFDQPEYPMTIQFNDTQCEPIAIQHFSLKEE